MSGTKGKKQITHEKDTFSLAVKKRREKKRKNKDKRNVPPKKAFKSTKKRKRVSLGRKIMEKSITMEEKNASNNGLNGDEQVEKKEKKRRKNTTTNGKRKMKKKRRRSDTRTIKSLYVRNNDFSPVVQSGLDDYRLWLDALQNTIKAQEEAAENGELGPLSSLDPDLYEKIKIGLSKNGDNLPERTHLWDYGYKKMEGFSSMARMKTSTRHMAKFIREVSLINLAQKSYNITRCTGSRNTAMRHVQLAKDRMAPISWGENRPMGTRILKKRQLKNKKKEEEGESGEETSEDLLPLAQEMPVAE